YTSPPPVHRYLHSFPTRRSSDLTGTPMIPIYCGGKHKLFRRTTVVFGEPYCPVIAGRRPTPEENHQAAEEILSRIYAMAEVDGRSEEHTSELQSRFDLVCRLLLE